MGQFIEKKNIVIAFEKYQAKDGQEKTAWRTIGEVAVFRNDDQTISEVVKLYSMPGANIRVFPPKDKQQTQQPAQPAQQAYQPQQQTQQLPVIPPTPASAIPVVNAGVPTQVPPVQAQPTDEIQVSQIPF